MNHIKIAINTCFGGFGLSNKGKAALAARKGITLTFWKSDYERSKRKYTKVESDGMFMTATIDGKEPGDDNCFTIYDIERDDPDLIHVIENVEGAGSGFSDLKVVEIPADVQWEIAEYDGMEHIAEKHRTWS